ncbi:DUF4817 domain-containing protein [Trichonephila clavipes]|nr:DUF4817 domain-containing protein [Trichonephila clavipes]
MITNFFIPELNNHDVQELWFKQDGATCHTARATIDLLKDTLGDRLISRFGPVNWPPRSCDLTPLDYFLWGYVKSLVYADKPQTLDHLEDNIRRVIADIRPQMLEKVIENGTSRLDYIRASRGSPMPEIIFKMSKLRLLYPNGHGSELVFGIVQSQVQFIVQLKTCQSDGLMHVKPAGARRPLVDFVGNFSSAFGDGPRNFEPWSSDKDNTSFPNFHTTPNGGCLSFDKFNVHRLAIHGESSAVPDSLMIRQTRVRYLDQ